MISSQFGRTLELGKLVLLPSAGRVLGLFPGDENVFWTNPDYHPDADWPNPGGDRIWLAPEREFFIEDLTRVYETYGVPSAFDPGRYSLRMDGSTAVMENAGTVKAHQSGVTVGFKLARRITPMPNLPSGSAGYMEETTLAVDSPIGVGYWNIVQVPQGGRVLFPCSPVEYQRFFGDPQGAVGSDVDFGGSSDFKVGFPPSAVDGLVGYRRGNSLIVRAFPVNRDALYVDTPLDTPGRNASVFQLYFGGQVNPFGEIEHHSPGISGNSQCSGRSFVQAFVGSDEELDRIWDALVRGI